MSLILWVQESQDRPADRSAAPPSTRLLLVTHRHLNSLPSCAVGLKNNHLIPKRFYLGCCCSALQERDILERCHFGLFTKVTELFSPLGWTWKDPLHIPSKPAHSVLLSALLNSRCFCPFKHMQLFYHEFYQPKQKIKLTMYTSRFSASLFQQLGKK